MNEVTHFGKVARVRVGEGADYCEGYCPECHEPEGEYHYPECDYERCGVCGDQWIICEHGPKGRERNNNGRPNHYASYADYLQGGHWQGFRVKVLEHWDYRCSLCNNEYNLEVHHRCYDRIGKERLTDCIVLCNKCHSLHSEQTTINRKWGEKIFEIYEELRQEARAGEKKK